jgi:addiction module RelE/StbE family toxin
MQVRWSPEAAADLTAIYEHIAGDDPVAAQRTVRKIYDRAGAVGTFPNGGRQGRVRGTRELPLPPLPFIVIYRIVDAAVEIANIIHGAQRWPR